jgi:hypothetical protein
LKEYEILRAIKVIRQSIENLNLDLSKKTILTEVGSNFYLFTPIIAALAGAEKVYAWTRDSIYGSGKEIAVACLTIAKEVGVEDRIEISVNEKPQENIKKADLITNSGFLRPLNKEMLSKAKKSVVIPLMFEAWEIRKEEIDIEYCINEGIKVAGTWEDHPKIKVFSFVKELAVKMVHEAGFEIMGSNFIVWSDDHFGKKVKKGLINNGAASVKIVSDFLGLMANISDLDVLFICDYDEERSYFGESGILNLKLMKDFNNSFGVVHLYGDIDSNYVENCGINIYPKFNGTPMNMTFTLGHVGLVPLINLQVAGFKVGQEMLTGNYSSLSQPITF